MLKKIHLQFIKKFQIKIQFQIHISIRFKFWFRAKAGSKLWSRWNGSTILAINKFMWSLKPIWWSKGLSIGFGCKHAYESCLDWFLLGFTSSMHSVANRHRLRWSENIMTSSASVCVFKIWSYVLKDSTGGSRSQQRIIWARLRFQGESVSVRLRFQKRTIWVCLMSKRRSFKLFEIPKMRYCLLVSVRSIGGSFDHVWIGLL